MPTIYMPSGFHPILYGSCNAVSSGANLNSLIQTGLKSRDKDESSMPGVSAYHVKCIDPWLLKNKKTCPVCKRRVIPGQDAESDSESDEENSTSATPTEATPLLGGQTRSSPSRRSTFDTSGVFHSYVFYCLTLVIFCSCNR